MQTGTRILTNGAATPDRAITAGSAGRSSRDGGKKPPGERTHPAQFREGETSSRLTDFTAPGLPAGRIDRRTATMTPAPAVAGSQVHLQRASSAEAWNTVFATSRLSLTLRRSDASECDGAASKIGRGWMIGSGRPTLTADISRLSECPPSPPARVGHRCTVGAACSLWMTRDCDPSQLPQAVRPYPTWLLSPLEPPKEWETRRGRRDRITAAPSAAPQERGRVQAHRMPFRVL